MISDFHHVVDEIGRLMEEAEFDRALALALTPFPTLYQQAYMAFMQGQIHHAQGQAQDGFAAIETARALCPHPDFLVSIAAYFINQGWMERAADLYEVGATAGHDASIRLQVRCLAMSDLPAKRLETALGRWSEASLLPIAVKARPRAPRSRVGRPLRVAFAASFIALPYLAALIPIFRCLDRTRIHATMYSCGTVGFEDRSITESVSVWHNYGEPDGDLAQLMRSERHDVLVDLDGIIGKFVELFATRPAPVTASWYNVVASIPAPIFDYAIVDRTVVPEHERSGWTEKLIDMPASYFCMTPMEPRPAPRPAPVASRGYPTFGSMNRPTKLGPATLESWARILTAVPTARLYLRNIAYSIPGLADRIKGTMGDLGVVPDRIEIHGSAPLEVFLDSYGDIDIALDTFPFNGGTTTFDALWQGVPVIGFMGDRLAARVTVSILRSAGLDELAAPDLASAEKLAVDLASDTEGVIALRSRVAESIRACPFTDAHGFADALTGNLEKMFDQSFPAAKL